MIFSVVVPARLHSSRLKNKLILNINNKPLIVYTLEQVTKSRAKNIYVATDCNNIKSIVEDYGFKAFLTNEAHQSGTDRILELIDQIKLNDNEVLVNVQGDEPLVDSNLINKVAQVITNKVSFASAYKKFITFNEYRDPNNVKVAINSNDDAITFSRSMLGNLDKKNFKDNIIFHHLGIYAYTVKQIKFFCNLNQSDIEKSERLEQLRAISNQISIKMIEHQGSEMIGVDTREDFEKVKKLLS